MVIVLALLVVVSVPLVRDEEVDLLVALEARDRVMVAEVGPHFVEGVIIGTLASVGGAVVVVLLVDRWDIEPRNAPRVSSRSRNRFSCHHLHLFSRFRVRVVMGRQVEVVPITIRVMLFLMPRDSISIPKTPIPRVVTLSILAAICRILQLQSAVLSGIREDSFSQERLLLAVQGLRDRPVSPVRGVVRRVAVLRLAEVAVDGSRPRVVFIIYRCRTLRTTQI